MNRLTFPLFAGLALASASATALPIIDVSMSVGVNRSSTDSAFDFFIPHSAADSIDGTEPRLTFNASLTSQFGVEIGWSKLGSGAGTATPPTICPAVILPECDSTTFAYAQSGSVLWAAYAPSIRIGSLSMMGKVGAARVERDIVVGDIELGDNQTEVILGAAGTWWFADSIGLRADVERVGSDVNQVGLSLTVGF